MLQFSLRSSILEVRYLLCWLNLVHRLRAWQLISAISSGLHFLYRLQHILPTNIIGALLCVLLLLCILVTSWIYFLGWYLLRLNRLSDYFILILFLRIRSLGIWCCLICICSSAYRSFKWLLRRKLLSAWVRRPNWILWFI